MFKKYGWIVVAMVVLATLIVLVIGVILTRPAPIVLMPVVISKVQVPYAGLIDIAEEKGFFTEVGIQASIKPVEYGPQSIQAVLSGQADFGTAAETPIATALVAQKPIKIIATIFQFGDEPGLIADRSQGISNPEDLKGKRIGVVAGTVSQYLVEVYLAFNQIPLSDVKIVELTPTDLVHALTSHQVDAIAARNPQFTQAVHALGDRKLILPTRDIYRLYFNLVVRPEYLASNKAVVMRVLKALLMASAYIASNPDDAIRIIANNSKMDINDVRDHWNPLSYELTLSRALLIATESQARWIVKRGLVSGGTMPDVLNAIELQPLQTLNPSGVTITR